MNYITHSLGGVAAGLLVISAGNTIEPVQQAAIMGGAILGSLFPDIDHRRSWIGHKLPLVADVAAGLFKHRGAIHTPVFIFVVSIVLGLLNWGWMHELSFLATCFIRGFIPGMVSHLVLDTLNVQGIMWMWPISDKRLHILNIRTNSIMETVTCVLLAVCLLGIITVG